MNIQIKGKFNTKSVRWLWAKQHQKLDFASYNRCPEGESELAPHLLGLNIATENQENIANRQQQIVCTNYCEPLKWELIDIPPKCDSDGL